jgi:uncharacterized protein (DUF433 family)
MQQLVSPSYITERDGELYAGDTRITVQGVIAQWQHGGLTPEQIVEGWPALSLATTYGVIAYYLDHRAELDEHFRRADAGHEQRRQMEQSAHRAADPVHWDDLQERIAEVRQRHAAQTDTDEGHSTFGADA